MGKRRASHSTKKAKKGAVICQKTGRACDSVSMNLLNTWCRRASLVACLILAVEGNLFIHNLANQARSIKDTSVSIREPKLVERPPCGGSVVANGSLRPSPS